MNDSKRAALAGTVCGTGKCSLNASIPVLAAAGIESCAAPAAVLAAPGNGGAVLHDLSGDLPAYAEQWKEAGLAFDAVAAGFPGTGGQADLLSDFLQALRGKDNLTVLGPSAFRGAEPDRRPEPEELRSMESVCKLSDMVVLGIGDAAALLGERGRQGPWDRRSVENLLRGLCSLGPKSAVIVGAWFSPDLQGAAGYSTENGSVSYAFSHRIGGEWFGSGDLFSASLLASLLGGAELSLALQVAVDFTADCIRRTREAGDDGRFGLKFEACLPKLIRELGLSNR